MENLYNSNDYASNHEPDGNDELLAQIKKYGKMLRKVTNAMKKKKKKMKKLKNKLKKRKKLYKIEGKRKPAERDILSMSFEALPAALNLADTVLKRQKR